jgi:hypothetical protein
MVTKKKVSKQTSVPTKGKLVERAFGPAADEFGKELAPLGQETGAVSIKVGRMLLAPVRGLVTGLETVGTWLREAVVERLKDVPEDEIVEPNPRIAVPAVQALVYSFSDELIREMFANLLAANMNAKTNDRAHPAFIEFIKQMTPIDARVLEIVSHAPQIEFRVKVSRAEGVHSSIASRFSFEVPGLRLYQIAESMDNLVRMGLVERRDEWPAEFTSREQEILEEFQGIFGQANEAWRQSLRLDEVSRLYADKHGLHLSWMGRTFVQICIKEKKAS